MKQIISTENAPQALGAYSQAVIHDGTVYCSGQIALNPETMEVVGQTAAEQTRQIMENLKAVLEAGGSDFSKALKTTVYLKDRDDFTSVNEVYGSYFPENPPARACVEAARLPKDVLVEIDCIAHV